MALRDQPYLPLFVKDFLSDEKLLRCSASATGVYIRLMCHMHKSETYGVFAIKDKDKISDDISIDFARVFSLFSPYSQEVIHSAFQELLEYEVLYIYRNGLCQKRMIKDGKLSDTRALSGKKGANKRYSQNVEICDSKILANGIANGVANSIANTEYEYAYEYATANDTESEEIRGNVETTSCARAEVFAERFDEFWRAYPRKVGKGKARESWGKIKPSAALHQKIIAAVESAKGSRQWQKDDGQYIPNPATWLNQCMWADEAPAKGGGGDTSNPFLQRMKERGSAK